MKRRRKVWDAGLSLFLLLALGVAAALLWPLPSEAEQKAAIIQEGMVSEKVAELLRGGMHVDSNLIPIGDLVYGVDGPFYEEGWTQNDGSTVFIKFKVVGVDHSRVASVCTTPADPIHPMTRLRRSLARFFPALKE
jgi:hypothetical protein